MKDTELIKAYELLQEKYNRHEKILIQAYKSLKQKEETLKILNDELSLNEAELRSKNEELKIANEILFEKNEIINKQNDELKATLQFLKEAQAHLIQSEKMASLGILTAGVAHEINNPLNYIMGAYVGLDTYFRQIGKFGEEHITYLLKSLKVGIDKASEIVDGLNQFSRNNSSNDEKCDLHAIIDNCLLMMNNRLKDQVVIEKYFTRESMTINGNVGKLHQVFINILTNALQAIDANGKISIRTQKKDHSAIVEISDNGAGISQDNLPKITDPFFTTKAPGEGTGLGLSISFSIIREHHGKLEFESDIGKGTMARIILPNR